MRHPQTSAFLNPRLQILVCAMLLAAVTIVSWNFICWPDCSLLPLHSWQWVDPLKVCVPLLLAACLTFSDHPAARVAILLVCCYVIFDLSLGAYERWPE